MAGSVTSGAKALGERQMLEDAYRRQIEPDLVLFMKEVHALAISGELNMVSVLARWREMSERVLSAYPSALLRQYLENSGIPMAAMETAAFTIARVAELSGGVSSPANLGLALRRTLGLEKKVSAGASAGTSVGGSSSILEDLVDALGDDWSKDVLTDAMDDSFWDLFNFDGEFDYELGRLSRADNPVNWGNFGPSSARTAATSDFGEEMIRLAREEGYTHKRWMTRYDSRVRPSHARADQQTVELDASFSVGDSMMRFPADALNGSLSEVSGCRCVLVLVNFGDRPWDYPVGDEPWNNSAPWRG